MYWLTGIAGLLLFFAPFVLGFAYDAKALLTSLFLGFIVVIVSVIERAQTEEEAWEYYLACLAGLMAMTIPFVFGFPLIAQWTVVTMGTIITVLAGSKVLGGSLRT